MKWLALLAGLLAALPAQGFGPYPYEEWRFILEFRRMPMAPTCREKFGQGTFVQTKKGQYKQVGGSVDMYKALKTGAKL